MIIVYFLRGLAHFLKLFIGTAEIEGREHIPESGPYIVVVNHMSKADPALLMLTLPPIRLRFFGGERWRKHLIFGSLLKAGGVIFVKRGEADRRALREARKALDNGSVFGLAPEGTRSNTGALIRAKDGAAYLATRSKVKVLPVGIANTDQIGYNLPRLRRTRMQVKVGPTFELPDLGRKVKGIELSAYTHLIMVHIAALLPERHWGYYATSPALQAFLNNEDPWPYCLEFEKVAV